LVGWQRRDTDRSGPHFIERFLLIRRYMRTGEMASPGDGTFGVLVVLDAAVVLAGCRKVEHGRLLGRPAGH
jgi:hypothetical protein